MTLRSRFNTAISLIILLLIVLSVHDSYGQRKRRPEDHATVGLKQREAEFYFTEGEKFYILEDYSKALIYYQRAIESNPENGTIHYKIAEVLSKSDKHEDLSKAALSIEQAIRLDRSNKYFYLLAANINSSMARFDKAAEAYEAMLREVKGTEEYLFELAAIYQYGNQMDMAIKTYDRAEDALGINETSSVQKMRLLMEAGKTKEGLAEGEKLIKAFPDDERFMMAFTEVLSQRGLRQEAATYLERFTADHPEAVDASMLLAGFYRDLNQEQKARPLLTALFQNPDVEVNSKVIVLGAYVNELNNSKARGALDQDKSNFAISLLEKLIATNPESPAVRIVGGDLYLTTGRNRDAVREYLLASETGEVNFEVWQNLLYLEIQLEQFDSVIKHAEQALEMFPNQGMIHYSHGYALLRKRLFEEAVFSFQQAKKLLSSNPNVIAEINGMLGEAYHALKQFDKSDQSFEEALSLNGNNPNVLNNYSYYLAIRKENLEKAEKMSATLIKNNPENPTYLDTHAWVLYSRQKYKEARKIIERAISTGKASASHFEHYGDILYQLGEVDAAVVQWEKARGLNAKSDVLNKKIANRKIYE